MPTHLIPRLFLLLALTAFLVQASAQVTDTAGESAQKDTLREGTPDTLSSYPVLLPGVGTWELNSVSGTTIADSLYPYIERRSGADLFRFTGGVYSHELGQGGLGRFLSGQGLPAGSWTFLADGLPLDDPSGAPFNIDIYPLEFSGSVAYEPPGTAFRRALNGTAGAVNFVSSGSRAIRPVSRLRYSQSAYGYSIVDGSLTQDVARGLNVTLGAGHPVYDGRFDNSALNAWGGRVKIRYDFGDAAVYVSDIFTRWERGVNDGVSLSTIDSLRYDRIRAVVNNPSATEKLVRHDFRAGTTVSGDSGRSRYLFEVNFSSVHREYRDDAGGVSAGGGDAVRETRRSQWYGLRAAHSREIAGQALSLGFLLQNRRVLGHPLIGTRRSLQSSLDGSLDLRIIPGLTLIPMARFDNYLETSRLSFGGDAKMRLAGPVSVRGGLSHAYAYPSFGQVSGIGTVVDAAAEDDPEQHDLLTAGIVVEDGPDRHVSLDIFYRNIRNRFVMRQTGVTAGPAFAFENNGAETRRGMTITGTFRTGSILATAAVDYLVFGKNFDRETTPAWNVRAGAYFRDSLVHNNLDLKLGLEGRYTTAFDGEYYSQRYELFFPSGERIPPAATVDFILVAGIGDAHIHFIWENLLNREYVTTVFYPMDDRAIRFGVTWDFVD